jgi:DNA-binding response OmpR family regulator
MEEPINILIVDDDSRNLTVLEAILDDPGYRLVRAESADQALLALVVEEFALLILDIRMPGMTGFELAQMIKERKKTALVPIIFLTVYDNDDHHVFEGYNHEAVDYLHKPESGDTKVAIFAELYRKNRRSRPRVGDATDTASRGHRVGDGCHHYGERERARGGLQPSCGIHVSLPKRRCDRTATRPILP